MGIEVRKDITVVIDGWKSTSTGENSGWSLGMRTRRSEQGDTIVDLGLFWVEKETPTHQVSIPVADLRRAIESL